MSSLDDQVARLLAGMGVAPAQEQDAGVKAVQAWLDAHGIDATIVSTRWQVLVLEAAGRDAYRLSWERDAIVSAAQQAGLACRSMRIRTRRRT